MSSNYTSLLFCEGENSNITAITEIFQHNYKTIGPLCKSWEEVHKIIETSPSSSEEEHCIAVFNYNGWTVIYDKMNQFYNFTGGGRVLSGKKQCSVVCILLDNKADNYGYFMYKDGHEIDSCGP